jgi:hypothetical protein
MPRFVILEHDHPHLHWDLMLETGEVLRTWRLSSPPEPGKIIAATFLADHRRLYLDYEGLVSRDRGSVKRWDAGTFAWVIDERARVEVTLHGLRTRGKGQLSLVGGQEWKFVLS